MCEAQETLRKHGIINLSGEINDDKARDIRDFIIERNLIGVNKELWMVVDSYGGDVRSAMAIVDMMKWSRIPVNTFGNGSIFSAAFLVFVCGERRVASANASMMCHNIMFTYDNEPYYNMLSKRIEEDRLTKRFFDTLKKHSKLSDKSVKNKVIMNNDVWLTPEDCLKYGFVDSIDVMKFDCFNNVTAAEPKDEDGKEVEIRLVK